MTAKVLFVLVLVLLALASHTALTSDGWYHDTYCWGKIDAIDPYCD
jgi:hypothetical protein